MQQLTNSENSPGATTEKSQRPQSNYEEVHYHPKSAIQQTYSKQLVHPAYSGDTSTVTRHGKGNVLLYAERLRESTRRGVLRGSVGMILCRGGDASLRCRLRLLFY